MPVDSRHGPDRVSISLPEVVYTGHREVVPHPDPVVDQANHSALLQCPTQRTEVRVPRTVVVARHRHDPQPACQSLQPFDQFSEITPVEAIDEIAS